MNRSYLSLRTMVAALAFTTLAATGANAQMVAGRNVEVEARGGINVPTFDIADVAEAGPSFGLGVVVPVSSRFSLMADADFGFHNGKDNGPDVNVFHYMAKVAYDVLDASASRWTLRLNAGVGAMTFDVDAPGLDIETYPAINVGAKAGYWVTDRLNVFVSPQGDIAFSDEDVLGTDNAWVWPFSAGLNFKL